jgi:hypothetical protein
VNVHYRAAGERRGEGEPELERRSMPSHPTHYLLPADEVAVTTQPALKKKVVVV